MVLTVNVAGARGALAKPPGTRGPQGSGYRRLHTSGFTISHRMKTHNGLGRERRGVRKLIAGPPPPINVPVRQSAIPTALGESLPL